MTRVILCIIAVACNACGGGGSDGSPSSIPDGPPILRGSAPSAAGWSGASLLVTREVSVFGFNTLAATLDDNGRAIVSRSDANPILDLFQSTAASSAWTPIPDLPFKYRTHDLGHFLVNSRLTVAIESTTDSSLVEASYDNGWSLSTIARAQKSNNLLTPSAFIASSAGQRAVFWDEYTAGNSTVDYFANADKGNPNWGLPTAPPYSGDVEARAASFLSSGEFVLSLAVDNTGVGTRFYRDNLLAYLYDVARWNGPTVLVASPTPETKVGCQAIAPLDDRRFALTWIEQSRPSGATETTSSVKFAYFDGLSRVTESQTVFPATIPPTPNSVPSCPTIYRTATGDLTFVWQFDTQVVARRFANGTFGTVSSLPALPPSTGRFSAITAIDGSGNLRLLGAAAELIFTSEYRADREAWSDIVPLWNGPSHANALAVNARGDAVATWLAISTPAPFRMDVVSLMTRRFTR